MTAAIPDTIRTAIKASRRLPRPLRERTDAPANTEFHFSTAELNNATGGPEEHRFLRFSVEPGGDRCR
ncbi:hypothetical protein ACIA9I_34845 [Streptomyces anulatus]